MENEAALARFIKLPFRLRGFGTTNADRFETIDRGNAEDVLFQFADSPPHRLTDVRFPPSEPQ